MQKHLDICCGRHDRQDDLITMLALHCVYDLYWALSLAKSTSLTTEDNHSNQYPLLLSRYTTIYQYPPTNSTIEYGCIPSSYAVYTGMSAKNAGV